MLKVHCQKNTAIIIKHANHCSGHKIKSIIIGLKEKGTTYCLECKNYTHKFDPKK